MSSYPTFDFNAFNRARIAHGVLMPLALIFFFVPGAILMRVGSSKNLWKIHATLQLMGLAILIAGFGMGLHVQQMIHIEWSDDHQILGTVVVCLFLLQPFLGAYNHQYYLRNGKKSVIGHIHLWLGRVIILVGLGNGASGLHLAREKQPAIIAYAVLAGMAALTYFSVGVWTGWMAKREGRSKNRIDSDNVEMPVRGN